MGVRGLWAVAGVLAAVVVLTLYVLLNGGDDGSGAPAGAGVTAAPRPSSSASPGPSYAAPEEWTEPERWASLPSGRSTDRFGSEVGFPRTADGAAAAAVAANTVTVEGDRSTVDEQLRLYHSYLGQSEQSPRAAGQLERAAEQTDRELAGRMGVTPGQALPAGAYARNHVVGFQVIQETQDEVALWLLTRTTEAAGGTAKERGGYTRTLVGVQWQDGDWKITKESTMAAMQVTQGKTKPEMVAVGDAEFNAAGWTAIREAS